MNKFLKSHFLLSIYHMAKMTKIFLFFLCTSHDMSFAMKRPCDIDQEISQKKQKSILIYPQQMPVEIKSNPEQLRDYITDYCQTSNNEMSTLAKNISNNFQKQCGLFPENWNYFVQTCKKIRNFRERFTSLPTAFQPSITSDIPAEDLKLLKNNGSKN